MFWVPYNLGLFWVNLQGTAQSGLEQYIDFVEEFSRKYDSKFFLISKEYVLEQYNVILELYNYVMEQYNNTTYRRFKFSWAWFKFRGFALQRLFVLKRLIVIRNLVPHC